MGLDTIAQEILRHFPGGSEDYSLGAEDAYLQCGCGWRFAFHRRGRKPNWSGMPGESEKWPWEEISADADAGDKVMLRWSEHVASAMRDANRRLS